MKKSTRREEKITNHENETFYEANVKPFLNNLKEIDMFKVGVNILLSRKETPAEYEKSKKLAGAATDGRKQT